MEHVPPDAKPLHDTGAVTLHENVGSFDKAQQQLSPGIRPQIQSDAALVAVDGVEKGALAIDERGRPAHVVTGLGLLHLDHVGAHVGEEQRAVPAGKQPGQVEDADSGQRHGELILGCVHTLVGDFRQAAMR